MALRSSWGGFLRLSLISVPVRAYNAAAPGGGETHFHQIHKECGNRIRYQKVCPVHGEVSKEDILSGYEYEKGKYLEIDPQELRKVRGRAPTLRAFIRCAGCWSVVPGGLHSTFRVMTSQTCMIGLLFM